MKFIKNKRIGKILFIVEGGKYEFSLIKKIFCDILGYQRIEKRRDKATYYVSKTDSHSVVAVINTKTSNIGSITENDYLDNIYTELLEQYSFDVANAAIYYVFDRDVESNQNISLIRDLIALLKNSRENEDNMLGGMLIMSYPSVEAYTVSNFVENSFALKEKLGRDVKEYVKQNAKNISLNKINEDTILHACEEIKRYTLSCEREFDADSFALNNRAIFEEEEQEFDDNGKYFFLSMMSYVLMDLGILYETDEE